jgi:hypothetical protein
MVLFGGLDGLVSLDKEEILKRVSQQDIFLIVFETVDIGKYYINPLREDSTPGCFFNWHNNKLWFCDFADDKVSRDCFEMIKDYYNLNFYQVLEYINDHFKLGLSYGEIPAPVSKEIITQPVVEKPKNYITYQAKSFDKHHKSYWTKYQITKQQLLSDNIYPTIWYRFWSSKKQNWVIIRPMASDVTYSINQWDDAVKICRAKHKGVGKWITNCTKNHIGGLDKLPFAGEKLIITKSYKDWRVLTNNGLSCIWFQNEGMFPDKDKLDAITSTYKKVVVWFDNDSTGLKASNKLCQLASKSHKDVSKIHLPIRCLKKGIKDPADAISKDNLFFHNFLKTNLLWKEK